MSDFKIGDIVARKSYGGDVYFRVVDVIHKGNAKPVYVLRGLTQRIHADSHGDDLVRQHPRDVYFNMRRHFVTAKRHAVKNRMSRGIRLFPRQSTIPGTILHIDSSRELLSTCLGFYRDSGLKADWYLTSEDQQTYYVRQLLERYQPDILVITGHDGLKKDAAQLNSMDNYRNSRYFVQSVREARRYEPSADKLCIFAGACQSYYEAIMDAGANFASSPGRILIDGLDPALVSDKVAYTDTRYYVTPAEAVAVTKSGSKGIGGINTRGHMTWS